jgi:hypothetical protein
MSDRQKLFLAILVSMLLHAGILLLRWHIRNTTVDTAKAARPDDLSRLVVTIMPPKPADVNRRETVTPPRPTPPPPPPRQFIRPALDSDGLTTSLKAPAHALFQSDSNMTAGSLLPPTGNIPLPSEAGPRRKFMEFESRPMSMGKGQVPSQPSRARQAAEAAPAMPLQTPYAITQVQHQPGAQAAPTPQAVPTPKPVPTPPDSLALGKPTPTPAPSVSDLARLTLRGQADMAPMPQQQPPPPRAVPVRPVPPSPATPEPNTQREMARTRIEGGISTSGPAAVDAVQTPFGRYHEKLSNLIGSRWQLYIQEHPKDVGEVTILVKLNPSGKIYSTSIIANHSADDLGELSTRAILDSDLPPVPDDLAPMLKEGKLEIPFHFVVYDPAQ